MYVCMYVCICMDLDVFVKKICCTTTMLVDLDVFEKDARVFNILVHNSYFWPPFPHKLTN